jgi:flagellar protein FlbD
MVAINPDHISWVDVNPDTTLCLIGGEKLVVRESLEELIDAVVTFRRLVRAGLPEGAFEGDPLPPALADVSRHRAAQRRSYGPEARTSYRPEPRASAHPGPQGPGGADR